MDLIYLTTCGLCNKEHNTYAGLSHHLSREHNDVSLQEYYDKFLKKPDDGVCKLCGNPTKFTGRLNRGYYEHCSKKCTANDKKTVEKRKVTNLELHGDENYNNHEQTEQTKETRYGDKNYANGDQIRATKQAKYGKPGYNNPEKRKATKAVKYGDPNYVNKEKAADTKEAKYDDPFFNNSKQSAVTKTIRYGSPNFVNPDKARHTVYKKTVDKYQEFLHDQCEILSYDSNVFHCKCKNCGHEFDIPINTGYMRLFRYGVNWCTVCTPAETSRSNEEMSLFDFVESLVGSEHVRKSVRDVIPYTELDIYLPDHNIAIEFDGLYWHDERRKANTYHVAKTNLCEEHGIHLVHVFEDEWQFQPDIVKSRIKGLLGLNERIFARKCNVESIEDKVAKAFLDENHLQGACVSSYRYGLFYQGELVSVMTFGKNRFGEGIELLRFANKINTNVVGGASKLFKAFINDHPDIPIIVSFADRRWSSSDAFYPKLGFRQDGISRPSYYYIINGRRHNRMEFTKTKLVAAGFPNDKSEHDIMLSRKIYRIYDCGNLRFIWSR